eukprot:COSAG05_NODE_220_length_13701_cov_24.582855_5_plen_167_part_00
MFDSCKQIQTRTRFEESSSKECKAEQQKRERVSKSIAVEVQGEKYSDKVTLSDWPNKGAWSGSFENEDCVQPGEQSEQRYRYRADGKCALESQTRKRNNGGKWSAWKCHDRKNKDVKCQAEQISCVETQTKRKYLSKNNVRALTKYSLARSQPWQRRCVDAVERLW